jgi:hypothetical protein
MRLASAIANNSRLLREEAGDSKASSITCHDRDHPETM